MRRRRVRPGRAARLRRDRGSGPGRPRGRPPAGLFLVDPLANIVHVGVGVLLAAGASRGDAAAARVNTLVGGVYLVLGVRRPVNPEQRPERPRAERRRQPAALRQRGAAARGRAGRRPGGHPQRPGLRPVAGGRSGQAEVGERVGGPVVQAGRAHRVPGPAVHDDRDPDDGRRRPRGAPRRRPARTRRWSRCPRPRAPAGPATSGPSIRRCSPCALPSLRTTKASTGRPARRPRAASRRRPGRRRGSARRPRRTPSRRSAPAAPARPAAPPRGAG